MISGPVIPRLRYGATVSRLLFPLAGWNRVQLIYGCWHLSSLQSKSVTGDLCASAVSGVRISAHAMLGVSANGYLLRHLTHREMSLRFGIVNMQARRDLISDSYSCDRNQFLYCSTSGLQIAWPWWTRLYSSNSATMNHHENSSHFFLL